MITDNNCCSVFYRRHNIVYFFLLFSTNNKLCIFSFTYDKFYQQLLTLAIVAVSHLKCDIYMQSWIVIKLQHILYTRWKYLKILVRSYSECRHYAHLYINAGIVPRERLIIDWRHHVHLGQIDFKVFGFPWLNILYAYIVFYLRLSSTLSNVGQLFLK